MKNKFKALVAAMLILMVTINAIGIGMILNEEKKQTEEARLQSDMAFITAWESTDTIRTLYEMANSYGGANDTSTRLRYKLMTRHYDKYKELIDNTD